MAQRSTIQLGEICRRLDVRERDARYVLEQGHVPQGVEQAPESGNYRQFDPKQAFWLAMVLKLKSVGVKTPLAATIANYAQRALQTVTQNLGWEWQFLPQAGRFDTANEYFVEVGDLQYIRFVTDAQPGHAGRLTKFDWHHVDRPGKAVEGVRPCAIIRLDLAEIARLLGGAVADPDGSAV